MASGGASGYHQSFFWRVYDGLAQALDHRLGWDRLPTPLGILVLIGTRDVLRKRNLYDTAGQPAVDVAPVAPLTDEARRFRTEDGTHNDLAQPAMGMGAHASAATCRSRTPSHSPSRASWNPAPGRSAGRS